MTTELPSGGPYKGLVPYSEEDAPFFFGREADREILIANLLGSRLTLLYGASGVGKSSLLQAGVVYLLRQLARQNFEEYGAPEVAVATFSTWQGDPLPGLLRAVQAGVEQAFPGRELEPVPSSLGLADALRVWSERFEGNLLILLDQFEEYFLYHPLHEGTERFADELARAVNEPDVRVGFLVAIREDSLAWLDRFKGRIPGLFQNYLRLDHLDREEARRAIRRPVEEYSRRYGKPFEVKPELVEEVLDQVAVGKVTVGEVGRGLPTAVQTVGEERIETPYLQLVMSRIWDEEMRLDSRVLRLKTLDNLGGAQRIVQTHLDATLAALSQEQQQVAARMFRYLVTPRGAKVALTVGDLGSYTELAPEQLTLVLERLARSDVRILRQVADQPETPPYEIFHDVLAAPILDWRRRFEAEERRRREQRRVDRLRIGIAGMAVLLTLMTAMTIWAFHQKDRIVLLRVLPGRGLIGELPMPHDAPLVKFSLELRLGGGALWQELPDLRFQTHYLGAEEKELERLVGGLDAANLQEPLNAYLVRLAIPPSGREALLEAWEANRLVPTPRFEKGDKILLRVRQQGKEEPVVQCEAIVSGEPVHTFFLENPCAP